MDRRRSSGSQALRWWLAAPPLAARAIAEFRAGKNLTDVFGVTPDSLNYLRDIGVLAQYTSPETKFVFDVLVQWGTLVGVLIYFRRDIVAIIRAVVNGLLQRKPFGTLEARIGWLVVVATIPAVIAGALFKKYVEQLYSLYIVIAIVLILGGFLMMAAEHWGKRQRDVGKTHLELNTACLGQLLQRLETLDGDARAVVTGAAV